MSKRDQQILFWTLALVCVGGMLVMIFTSHGPRGLMVAGVGAAWVLYVLGALMLFALTVLMPYFVYVCARELKRIRELLEKEHEERKGRSI